MLDDAELLRRYAQTRDERAFSDLIARHVNLVFSAALRQTAGDSHVAQDVTQSVFTDLARKAAELAESVARGKPLAGWLYTSTRFAASRHHRAEQRRQLREQAAHAMNETLSNNGSDDATWAELRPLLDDAMGELAETDRDAVLLRFFEGRDLRSVGAALGLSEDAARKRVSRALDKLRDLLAARGVTTTSAALSAALLAQSIQAAPVGLAAALAGAAAASAAQASTLISVSGLLQFMSYTKIQTGIVAAIAIGAASTAFIQHRELKTIRSENVALRQAVEQRPTGAPIENAASPDLADQARRQREHEELMRLRGEVTLLRQERVERQRSRANETTKLASDSKHSTSENNSSLSSDLWSDVGFGTPEAAIQTFLWSIKNGSQSRYAAALGKSESDAGALGWGQEVNEVRSIQIESQDVRGVAQEKAGELPAENEELFVSIEYNLNSGGTEKGFVALKKSGHQWRVSKLVGFPIRTVAFPAGQNASE